MKSLFQKIQDCLYSSKTMEIIGRVLIIAAIVLMMALFVIIVGKSKTQKADIHELRVIPDIPTYVPEVSDTHYNARLNTGSMTLSEMRDRTRKNVSASDSLSGFQRFSYEDFVKTVLSEENAWKGYLHFLMYAFPLMLLVWIIVKLIGKPSRPKTVYETRTIVKNCELPADVLRRKDVFERCLKVSEKELATKYGYDSSYYSGPHFWEWLYNKIERAEDIPAGAVGFVKGAFMGGNILTLEDYDYYVRYVNKATIFKNYDYDLFFDFTQKYLHRLEFRDMDGSQAAEEPL